MQSVALAACQMFMSWAISAGPRGALKAGSLHVLGACAGLFSIEILAMCPGGGWRTLSEWKTMFAKHGYQLEDTKLVGANMSLMVWSLSQ